MARMIDQDLKEQMQEAVSWGIHGKRWHVHGKWLDGFYRHPTRKQMDDAFKEGKRLKAAGFKCTSTCPICGGFQ